MMHTLLAWSRTIQRCTEWFGRTLSWLVLALTALVTYDVTMRYAFNAGSIALQELEWHLFSALILLSIAYAHKHDAHVRMDLVYRSRLVSDRGRLWIDILGTLLLLIPFSVLVIISSWPFVAQSWLHAEGSPDPGGLPYRWLIKSCIPAGFLLLVLQGLADLIDKIAQLQDRKS